MITKTCKCKRDFIFDFKVLNQLNQVKNQIKEIKQVIKLLKKFLEISKIKIRWGEFIIIVADTILQLYKGIKNYGLMLAL